MCNNCIQTSVIHSWFPATHYRPSCSGLSRKMSGWFCCQCVSTSVGKIQPDILSPPLLRLTYRKPLWLDLQPVDIKSQWRTLNWKLAQVVNSHLVCDPTIQQPGFDLPQQQWSLLNRFCMEQGHCGACRRNGDLQTLICVLVARPRWCPTLSNPVPWQNWMVAYLGYTLELKLEIVHNNKKNITRR